MWGSKFGCLPFSTGLVFGHNEQKSLACYYSPLGMSMVTSRVVYLLGVLQPDLNFWEKGGENFLWKEIS